SATALANAPSPASPSNRLKLPLKSSPANVSNSPPLSYHKSCIPPQRSPPSAIPPKRLPARVTTSSQAASPSPPIDAPSPSHLTTALPLSSPMPTTGSFSVPL